MVVLTEQKNFLSISSGLCVCVCSSRCMRTDPMGKIPGILLHHKHNKLGHKSTGSLYLYRLRETQLKMLNFMEFVYFNGNNWIWFGIIWIYTVFKLALGVTFECYVWIEKIFCSDEKMQTSMKYAKEKTGKE